MSYTRKNLQNLIGVFGEILGCLSESELRGLINGEGRLIYQPCPPLKEKGKLPREDTTSRIECSQLSQELVQTLLLVESKEEALLLLGKNLRKSVLVEIAEALNVHLRKSNTKEIIIQKIIESAVGARLRSKAIKEMDIGRKSSQGK
jgi:hypothetical protein